MRGVRFAFGYIGLAVLLGGCGIFHQQQTYGTKWTFKVTPSPTAVPTTGLPFAPSPVPTPTNDVALLHAAALHKVCGKTKSAAALESKGSRFVACSDGHVFRLDRAMRAVRRYKTQPGYMSLDLVNPSLLIVTSDSQYSAMTVLHARTLEPIGDEGMVDSSFLGVLGDRAYINDACCFGRLVGYQPATIYFISLSDGGVSPRVDLKPDAAAHGDDEPPGQGGANYMIGKYLYVVVRQITYRYDLTDLNKPPLRMKTVRQL